MKLGELISKIEKKAGTSITDPTLLEREVLIGDDLGEHPVTGLDPQFQNEIVLHCE